MDATPLSLENPLRDAISRVRFAPRSNNLLISSWDNSLRLYDVESSKLRLESQGEAALLDCCLENDSVAFSAASDGSIHRYDMHSGHKSTIGNHDDMATFVEYSPETCQLITAGWDKNIIFWDAQSAKSVGHLNNLTSEPKSMYLSGFNLMVAIDSSVIIYDFRSLRKSVHKKDIRVKCVRPILHYEGFVVGSVDGRVALEYICESNLDKGYAFRCHPKGTDGRNRVESVNDIAFSPLNSGSFVTGDNEGYVIMWDACYKKRLFEFSRYPNSIASLSYNHDGFLLAVASSYTYQEAGEREELPQIFIHKVENFQSESPFVGTFRKPYSLQPRILETVYKKRTRAHTLHRLLAPTSYVFLPSSPDFSTENMSDEEHHFESKADAGASKTYPQQAGTIRKNGYIVIKNRPCKVVEVSTSKTGKHGHAKCHFVAIDIFTAKKLEDIVPSSHNCDVPHVSRTDYQLIDISEDGFVSLLTDNGNTKDDLRLPTDESLLTQIKDGFGEGKDLVVSVMSAMGEEQICALKDIGPKN
ncbi:PREDICTED: mitotic checkpoint protein BUB3.3-like [Ipomoea nil]|nr:PREDICTED: mitotic checkpoint protein BUB3.3-like [Ipomoea nil]